ncbi:MAG: HEAT repeat domain-containing protein [Planctomycetota bacterium]
MGPPTPRRRARRVAVLVAAFVLASAAAPAARADFESAKKHFADNVKAPDWKARRSAYGAFQDHDGGPAAATILAATATETHPVVLAAAADTLARFRSDGARQALLASFKGKGTERIVAAHALRGVRGAEVDAALVAALADAPPNVALLAAAALGTPGRTGAPAALAAALAADAPVVRSAAARALGTLGDRAAVGPLVARLATEKGRVRGDVIAALEAITRQALGDAPAAWAAVAAGTDPKLVEAKPARPPTCFGIPVTGERVVFVIDRSLQMDDPHALTGEAGRERLQALCTPPDGERIPWRQLKSRRQLAQAHVRHAVLGLPASARFEVIVFAEDVAGVFGKKLVPPNAASEKALDDAFGKLQTDDGINVWEALLAALDLGGPTDDKALKAGPDQILLVLNNVPTKGDVTDPDAVEKGIAFRARTRGVPISVVDLGAHRQLLAEGIAKGTGGTYLDLTK